MVLSEKRSLKLRFHKEEVVIVLVVRKDILVLL